MVMGQTYCFLLLSSTATVLAEAKETDLIGGYN